MNNTILINTLYLLIPFTIYGLVKFSIWWFKKLWNDPNDIFVVMAIGGLTPTWAIYTLVMIHNKFPNEIMPLYGLWTLFAPIGLIVSFIGHFSKDSRKNSFA